MEQFRAMRDKNIRTEMRSRTKLTGCPTSPGGISRVYRPQARARVVEQARAATTAGQRRVKKGPAYQSTKASGFSSSYVKSDSTLLGHKKAIA